MSKTLEANPEIARLVHADLVRGISAKSGSEGLRGDQVLRAAILYHYAKRQKQRVPMY